MDQLNSLVAIMSNDHGDTVIQEEFLYRIGEEYFVFHQKNRALLFLHRQGCSRLHMTEEGIMPKPAKCFQPPFASPGPEAEAIRDGAAKPPGQTSQSAT